MAINWQDAVARAVRRGQADLKISQEALTESAGLSRNYVSRIESGGADLSQIVFTRLATALGSSPWQLLKDAEEALPTKKRAIRASPAVSPNKPIKTAKLARPKSPVTKRAA
jgi:transcriptional regulator with XRE-family HTH domain